MQQLRPAKTITPTHTPSHPTTAFKGWLCSNDITNYPQGNQFCIHNAEEMRKPVFSWKDKYWIISLYNSLSLVKSSHQHTHSLRTYTHEGGYGLMTS